MAKAQWYRMEPPDAIILNVKVFPRARKKEMVPDDFVLKVKITEPAVEGAANKGLKKYLSTLFGVSQSRITILRGEHNRTKVVKLSGVEFVSFENRVSKLLAKDEI